MCKKLILLSILISMSLSNCSIGNHNSDSTVIPALTLDPKVGMVSGRILVLTMDQKVPVSDQILYLANVIHDNQNNPSLAAFDRVNSPRALTDQEGNFIFMNIEPGLYGLVIDVITDSYLLMKPGTQEALIIEVKEGKNTELGELIYDNLPIEVSH